MVCGELAQTMGIDGIVLSGGCAIRLGARHAVKNGAKTSAMG